MPARLPCAHLTRLGARPVKTLVLLALVGLGAQLVDGSLGMAYGVTSTTLLLAIGTNPAAASATVHFAEIGTSLMSGLAHWKFGNVDWKVVAKVGFPGAVGAFVDATGGGGWGPVGTPALLASGRMEPRKVIGSIDTSEFLIAVAASLGFLVALGSQGVDATWALGLLAGGLVAAPLAAWLVRHVPPRMLGSLVGGMIVLTNTRTLLRSDWIDAADPVRYAVYAALYAVWAAAVVHSFREHRRDRVQEAADAGRPASRPTCRPPSRGPGGRAGRARGPGGCRRPRRCRRRRRAAT